MVTASRHRHEAHVDAFLPLKPVVFQILLALAQQERHGYAILQSVRRNSRGKIHLETGPLYRHLARLLDDQVIAESAPKGPEDPRRGRFYRLTDLGQAVLSAETARLEEALSLCRQLGLSAPEASR